MSERSPGVTRPRAPSAGGLHGINTLEVISTIRRRAERWRSGDLSPDGRKIGLVFEGGAMRGVCSGGGAVALQHLGLTSAFDEVYATSAGAMNASYFLSGQAQLGISVYYEDLVSPGMINPFRVWKVFDIDRLFDRVVLHGKRLDVEALLSSRSDFFVATMDRYTGEGILIDAKRSESGILDVLKAATAMPLLYNRHVLVNGRASVDGGLAIPLPVEQAVRNGCSDVLVLLNRAASYCRSRAGGLNRTLFNLLFSHGRVALNQVYSRRHECDKRARDMALGLSKGPTDVNIATLCPDCDEPIGRITTNPALLRHAAVRFARMTLRIFDAPNDAWDWIPPLGRV